MGNFLKQFFEGLSCDSLAPVLFSKPISDLKFSFLGVARNMTSYSSSRRIVFFTIPVESMIRFQCASKAALSCGSSLTNAAIRLASRSSCCSKKMEMSEDSTFRIVIVTELFILYFLPNYDSTKGCFVYFGSYLGANRKHVQESSMS